MRIIKVGLVLAAAVVAAPFFSQKTNSSCPFCESQAGPPRAGAEQRAALFASSMVFAVEGANMHRRFENLAQAENTAPQAGDRPAAEVKRITFHVIGLMKTKSGAT